MKIKIFKLLVMLLIVSDLRAGDGCEYLKKEIPKLIIASEFWSVDSIDLDKTFTELVHKEYSFHNSNIYLDKEDVLLPFYFNRDKPVSLSKFNAHYVFKDNDLTITGGKSDYANVTRNEIEYTETYPIEYHKYEGFKYAYNNISDYQLFQKIYSMKYSDFKSNDSFKCETMFYLMGVKAYESHSKTNWYNIDRGNYKMIVNSNELDNSLQIRYYFEEFNVELNYYYSNPIVKNKLENWLSGLIVPNQRGQRN
jgi:hypothetical protein